MNLSFSVLTRFRVIFLAAVLIWAPGCGDDSSACDDFNWRSPTPSSTVCPRTGDCLCTFPDVCCVTMDGNDVRSATCSDLTACAGLAFECDGPEDCASGDECCAVLNTGGGSSCVAGGTCIGLDSAVLCRSTDDCGPIQDCLPAEPGSYFDGVAGYCD